MQIAELITKFGFDVDDKALKELDSGIQTIKAGLVGVAASVGGAALTLFGFAKSSADTGDRLYKMSQQVGIGVEKLQQLSTLAELSDVSLDEFGQSVNILSRNLVNAKNGSQDSIKAFKAVGISFAQIRSGALKSDQVIEVVAKRFEKLPNGPEKTALAMEIFGRSGARLIPMLNSLSRGLTPVQQAVLELNAVTTEQAMLGEEFNDSLHTMWNAFKGISKTIGLQLLPVLKDVVETVTMWVVENKDLLKTNITGFVNALTRFLKGALKVMGFVVDAVAGLGNAFGGAETATLLFISAIGLLSGLSVLFGIGKVIQAVYGLAVAFSAANAAALLVPVAIGAALLILLAVMEDIFSFFQGKNSITGLLLRTIPEIGETFKTAFEPIFEPFVRFFTLIEDGNLTWKNGLLAIAEIITNLILLPIRGVTAAMGGITSLVGRLTGNEFLKSGGNFLSGAASKFTASGIGESVSSLVANVTGTGSPTGITPTTRGDIGGSTTNAPVDARTELTVTNQFNYPPGTDPATTGNQAASNINDTLESLLRQTQRANAGGR